MEQIKVGERQKILDGVEKITMNKMEITFSSYESFRTSRYVGTRDAKYVEVQLKEMIDRYHTQINLIL